jgi:hypothetical protein
MQQDLTKDRAMTGRELKISMLGELVEYFNEQGFEGCYASVHGIDPGGRLGRDIDLLVVPKFRDALSNAALAFFEGKGWQALRVNTPWGHIVVGCDLGSGICAVEVDFVEEYFWGVASLIRGQCNPEFYSVAEIPCARWESFAKRVLLQILSGNLEKYKSPEKSHELCIYPEEKQAVSHHLQALFGRTLASEIELAVKTRDWQWFADSKLRCGLLFTFSSLLHSPIGFVRNLSLRVRVKRWLKSVPQAVPDVICSADTAEDARVYCEALRAELDESYVFSSIDIYSLKEISEFNAIKHQAVLKQRMLGLILFYCDNDSGLPDSKSCLRLNADQGSYVDAARVVIHKHIDMQKKGES